MGVVFLVSWHIPQRVIAMQVSGDLSLDELQRGSETAIELIRMGITPVHCIGDVRYIGKFPLNLSEIKKSSQFLQEPNLGNFLFLSNNAVLNTIASAMAHMSKVNLIPISDPNAVNSTLRSLDISLPSLPPYTFSIPEVDN